MWKIQWVEYNKILFVHNERMNVDCFSLFIKRTTKQIKYFDFRPKQLRLVILYSVV